MLRGSPPEITTSVYLFSASLYVANWGRTELSTRARQASRKGIGHYCAIGHRQKISRTLSTTFLLPCFSEENVFGFLCSSSTQESIWIYINFFFLFSFLQYWKLLWEQLSNCCRHFCDTSSVLFTVLLTVFFFSFIFHFLNGFENTVSQWKTDPR